MIGTYTLINNVGVNKFTVEKTEEAIKDGLCRKTTKWVQQDIVRRQTNQNTQQRKQTSLLA
jgi:hypothetical protein